MGKDDRRTVVIYRGQPGAAKTLEGAKYQVVGSEKGHSDDVFALEYNPVTDHVVAVGKKFIRFFGVKEGYS